MAYAETAPSWFVLNLKVPKLREIYHNVGQLKFSLHRTPMYMSLFLDIPIIFYVYQFKIKQEAPRSIMGRRATDVNHLAFSVAKVLQKETGTLGQVPTVGCQPGGLRMHVWFKWINWVNLLLDQNKVGIVI